MRFMPAAQPAVYAAHGSPCKDGDKGVCGAGELVNADTAPAWSLRPHILSGYRRPQTVSSLVSQSLRLVHNETGNVVTHGLAFVLHVWFCVAVWRAMSRAPSLPADLQRTVYFYCACVGVLFATSTLYHLLTPHSEGLFRVLYRCDVATIVLGYSGGNVAVTMFGLRDFADVRSTLLWADTIMLVLGTMCVTRTSRVGVSVGVFALLLVIAFAKVCTVVWLGTIPTLLFRICVTYAAYAVGTAFYLSHWPESARPGRHDICGCSHQLWHVATGLGILNFDLLVWEMVHTAV